MFTGIVEEVGAVQELRMLSQGAVLTIGATAVLEGLRIGDSIAVNGVCLTATRIDSGAFQCDVSSETLRLSSFRIARQGSRVNLERALQLGGRLGGHLVLGHVDGVGRLIARTSSGEGYEMSFDFPRELERYLVHKGSITVNGISLTIASLERGVFSTAVIPHTYESTNLNQLTPGDLVNLEVDILGKYFERFFQLGLREGEKAGGRITSDYLRNQGF